MTPHGGGRNARTLGGEIGPQRQEKPGLSIDELKGLPVDSVSRFVGEDLQIFKGRGQHFPKTPTLEDREEFLLDPTEAGRLGRGEDADPFGNGRRDHVRPSPSWHRRCWAYAGSGRGTAR